MSIEFLKQINEFVFNSYLEAGDDEILSLVNKPDYPTSNEIEMAAQLVKEHIKEEKHTRLARIKSKFTAFKINKESKFDALIKRPVNTMFSEIVTAIQNSGEGDVPEGISFAFREQNENVSDDDIRKIWQNLVELGLIDPDKDEFS